MLKKILAIVVAVAVLAIIPALSGCADESKSSRHVEVHDQVIQQDTVVQ